MANEDKIFRPRRGRKDTMLKKKPDTILHDGEMFIELPESFTGPSKMKIGDGVTTYENLPYAIGDTENDIVNFSNNTEKDIEKVLESASSGNTLKTIISSLKQAITICNESMIDAADNARQELIQATDKYNKDLATIFDKCVELGVEPTANTSDALIIAIRNMYDTRYKSGYDQGYLDGAKDGGSDGYTTGYARGKADGYNEGYAAAPKDYRKYIIKHGKVADGYKYTLKGIKEYDNYMEITSNNGYIELVDFEFPKGYMYTGMSIEDSKLYGTVPGMRYYYGADSKHLKNKSYVASKSPIAELSGLYGCFRLWGQKTARIWDWWVEN